MSGYHYENLNLMAFEKRKTKMSKSQKEVKILSVQAVCLKRPLL